MMTLNIGIIKNIFTSYLFKLTPQPYYMCLYPMTHYDRSVDDSLR